ncbi:MAG: hypothetical protein HYV14_08775 [Elusimicrobia bacterium]|nr:hypothetical protein [Elusimicrobiota bacterium]
MKKLLLPVLLLCASNAAAQIVRVGCTPVEAEPMSTEELERDHKPLLRGEGAAVALLARAPRVEWDLGEKRTARLGVYLTRACALGLSVSVVPGGELSSPYPDSAIAELSRMLKNGAPDWALSVTPPNTISVRKGAQVHSTDLPKLLQRRLDAATVIAMNGSPVRVIFDGWLLFIVPENAEKALNLSVRSSVYPWAYYDLTPYGLPRLVARFDKDQAVLWALP